MVVHALSLVMPQKDAQTLVTGKHSIGPGLAIHIS